MSLKRNLGTIKEGDKILVQPEKQYLLVTEEEAGCTDQCIYGKPVICDFILLEEKLFLLSDIFANLKLGGKRGYDNALNIVNKICKEIYGISASSIDRRCWEEFKKNERLSVNGDYWVPAQIVHQDEWRNFHGIIISSGSGELKRADLFVSDRRISSMQEMLECSENTCEAGLRFLMEV